MMAIMVSSTLRPEEKVRQKWIQYLVDLGFPRSLMILESSLKELPHLKHEENLPLRRVDILAYGHVNGELKPLVLVECKRETLDQKTLFQVLGYNHYVKARFIVLASGKEFCIYNTNTHQWEDHFDSYSTICLQT